MARGFVSGRLYMIVHRRDTYSLDDGLVVVLDYDSTSARPIRVLVGTDDASLETATPIMLSDPEVLERVACILASERKKRSVSVLVCADHGYQAPVEGKVRETNGQVTTVRRAMRCPLCVETEVASDTVDRLKDSEVEP